MSNYNKEIGKWLAIQRKNRGYDQDDVGRMLGVTKTAISRWETGKRTINGDTMIEYCLAIGADPQDLVRDITKNNGG